MVFIGSPFGCCSAFLERTNPEKVGVLDKCRRQTSKPFAGAWMPGIAATSTAGLKGLRRFWN
jgi:hypothetical protein